MASTIVRATSFGIAFVNAAQATKVDHWVARRVMVNAEDDHRQIGVKREPGWNASLSYRTAQHLKNAGVL